MKVLEPVEITEIPLYRTGRISPFEEVFQQALQLNGLALSVEFENYNEALRLAHACQSRGGRGKVLGLVGAQRGTTVFLYRRQS